jgi:hypothetical protein
MAVVRTKPTYAISRITAYTGFLSHILSRCSVLSDSVFFCAFEIMAPLYVSFEPISKIRTGGRTFPHVTTLQYNWIAAYRTAKNTSVCASFSALLRSYKQRMLGNWRSIFLSPGLSTHDVREFKVCNSVHHRIIQINHQPDATIF